MKTFIILVLLVGLIGASYFTCPTQASFKQVVQADLTAKAKGLFGKWGLDGKIDGYFGDCQFQQRGLWTEVRKDGTLIYVGAFSHWFGWGGEKGVAKQAMPTEVVAVD